MRHEISYKKGVFQKMSNWQRRPDITRMPEVMAEKIRPTMNQLSQ